MSNNYYEDYLAKTNDNLRESTLLKQEKKKPSSNKKTILLIILFIILVGEGIYLWQENQNTQATVDNPSETLLPMTKPTETITEKNITIQSEIKEIEPLPLEKNITREKETIKEVVPKIVTKTIPKVEIVEKNISIEKATPEISIPVVIEKNITIKKLNPPKEITPKEKPIVKIVPTVIEDNTSSQEIKKVEVKIIEKSIHPLETSLLAAIEKSQTHQLSIDGKKIDTFNKVILDRSVTEASNTVKKLSRMLKDFEIRKTQKPIKVIEDKKSEKKTTKKTYKKALSDEAKVRKKEMRYVTVKSGDSLYKIAKRVYGDPTKFEIIFKANSDILKKKTDLKIGQKLRVPKLKKAQ